jgi:outer membrane receptor protein involved in Fe transport
LLVCVGWFAVPASGSDSIPAGESVAATVVVVGMTPLPGAELDRDQVAAPVQTADAQDIEHTHALDLTAFMNRTLGSVYVNDIQNNPLQPDLNYRGFTASPLLGTPQGLSVYLDGVRLNQPFGDVMSWDLIPRQAIAVMALVPGSNPLFGLNTLGGALALRSKDGYSDPGLALQVGYGSNRRRSAELEYGGHAASGWYAYTTANTLSEAGWREASPSQATQAFGKLGWRDDVGDVALSGAWADTELTGNGLQDQQLLARDYASVYTKPDNTHNEAWLANLVATRKVGDLLTLSGNAFYRNIRTATLNGDINDDSLGESLYQPTAGERAALLAAGYTGFPTSGETQGNTPFPSWRCVANILLDSEPNEKCNGLLNRTQTRQHESGMSVQATFNAPLRSLPNQLTAGVALSRSGSMFLQSAQFGYLTPDRGVTTVAGPGAFADGTQDSENAFDARVDLGGATRTRSIYFTDTLQVAGNAHLTLSARYDHSSLESVDALTPAGAVGSLSGSHRFGRLNPAAGLTVKAGSGVTAFIGYNEGSRAPSVIELGCADPDNPCKLPNAMAGDPPLQQVVARTLETGLRGGAGDSLAWNAGVFRTDNRNDILFVADEQAGFGYFRNFGRTRRRGAELGVRSRIGNLNVGANLTLLDATYRSTETVGGAGNSSNAAGAGFEGTIDIAAGDRIALIPRHIFKALADWRLTPKFTASADLIAVAGSIARGNENNAHQPDGLYYLGAGRNGGYAVLNLGAEYRPVAALSIYAQFNNVLDRKYFSAAQLGTTGFDAAGHFVARPFAGPVVDGERPLLGSTFYAPGAPRALWMGVRYAFSASGAD